MSEIHVPQYNKSLNVLPIAPIKKQINCISSHLYFDLLLIFSYRIRKESYHGNINTVYKKSYFRCRDSFLCTCFIPKITNRVLNDQILSWEH